MSRKTIRLSREPLYELIWSRPMSEAAKQYGLSDVGLAKICRRLNIPIPGRGYWAKKEAGHAPPRPPLPAIGKGEQSEAVITRQELPPPEPAQLSEAERLIAFENAPENRITVDPTQHIQHPLVARTEKSLRAAKRDETGLIRPRAKGCLDVQIAPASIDRAARILDALAQALEARGVPLVVGADDPGSRVTMLGVSHEIALEESTDRKVRELTPARRKRNKKIPGCTGRPSTTTRPRGGSPSGSRATAAASAAAGRMASDSALRTVSTPSSSASSASRCGNAPRNLNGNASAANGSCKNSADAKRSDNVASKRRGRKRFRCNSRLGKRASRSGLTSRQCGVQRLSNTVPSSLAATSNGG